MDDFEDSDLSALFADMDQIEATRKASRNMNKVGLMHAFSSVRILVPESSLPA